MHFRKHAHFAIIPALLLCGIILRGQLWGQASKRPEAKTITLALVAETHQKEVEEHFKDFVSYVARKLSPERNLEGRVAAVQNQSRLANLLSQRRADFYMESPHPTHMINNVYGAGKLLLRRWKGGMSDYHSLIFALKNGPTKRLEDLRGKIIAFEDPESTSGYYLPKLLLSKKGFKLAPMRNASKTDPGTVGYVFASSQKNLLELVLTGKVAAGAFSNDDHAGLADSQKSDLVILAETASLPRHLVSVRKDLSPAVSDPLKRILLTMHEDAEGRVILQKTDGTTKFDTLPGGELAISQRLLDTFYAPEKR
jgi:phosphonate transport system substrate-binding protein